MCAADIGARRADKAQHTVAPLLLPLITREVRHAVNKQAIKRGFDAAKHRSVCGECDSATEKSRLRQILVDFCSSTIFGGYFFCKKCGRDFCLQCERYFSDSMERIRESPWDLPDAARPRLLKCTGGIDAESDKAEKKKKSIFFHIRPDLQPVSSFSADELRDQWLALLDFVLDGVDAAEDAFRILDLGDDETEMRDAVAKWISGRPRSPDPNSGDEQSRLSRILRSWRTYRCHTPSSMPIGWIILHSIGYGR